MQHHYQSSVLVIVVSIVMVAAPHPAHAQCDPQEVQKLLASDGEDRRVFGFEIDIDGDFAVIGSQGEGANILERAYVFRQVGGESVEESVLTGEPDQPGNRFGQEVAIQDDAVVVGAPFDDDAGPVAGAVYIFRRVNGKWVREAKLFPDDPIDSRWFGSGVAIDGDRIVAGAMGFGAAEPGVAYVFRHDGSGWSQEAKITASDGFINNLFGSPVTFAGDTLVVGASWDDEAGDIAGAAYVFGLTEQGWVEQEKLIGSETGERHVFGFPVKLEGDVLAVGPTGHDSQGSQTGAIYLFRRAGGTWIEEDIVIPQNAAAGDQFGRSLALTGDSLVAGSWRADRGGNSSGAAYVFQRMGSTWFEVAELEPSDRAAGDVFGLGVGAEGATAIVGSPGDDDLGPNSGSAYVFDLNCGLAAELTDFTIIDGTLIGGGLPELASSDDTYLETEAKVTGEAAETHRMLMRIRAMTAVENPTTIDITLEGHITDIEAIVTLFLRNFQTGLFEQVGQFTNGLGADTTNTVSVPNASRFVRPNGRIVLRVKKIVIEPLERVPDSRRARHAPSRSPSSSRFRPSTNRTSVANLENLDTIFPTRPERRSISCGLCSPASGLSAC